jgi:hypothetical protein
MVFIHISIGLGQIYAISYLALIFGLINVSLLLGLLYSYWKTYKEVKSGFTIGLLYFTSLILLQNIFIIIFLGIYLILLPMIPTLEFHEPGVTLSFIFREPSVPLFFINLIQLIALSILFKITRE